MNDTRYDLEPDFDDYDSYADSQVTGVGLPIVSVRSPIMLWK